MKYFKPLYTSDAYCTIITIFTSPLFSLKQDLRKNTGKTKQSLAGGEKHRVSEPDLPGHTLLLSRARARLPSGSLFSRLAPLPSSWSAHRRNTLAAATMAAAHASSVPSFRSALARRPFNCPPRDPRSGGARQKVASCWRTRENYRTPTREQ